VRIRKFFGAEARQGANGSIDIPGYKAYVPTILRGCCVRENAIQIIGTDPDGIQRVGVGRGMSRLEQRQLSGE
jgi:hypothetical protein